MTSLGVAPAPKGLPLQAVDVLEQSLVVSDVPLKSIHCFSAVVVAYRVRIVPLGFREKVFLSSDIDVVRIFSPFTNFNINSM